MAAFTSTAAVQPVNQDRLSIRLTPPRRRSSFLGRNSSGRHHGREGKPADAAEERYGANSFLASPATIQSGSLRWLDRVSMLELPRQPAAAARLRLTADAVRLPPLRVSAVLGAAPPLGVEPRSTEHRAPGRMPCRYSSPVMRLTAASIPAPACSTGSMYRRAHATRPSRSPQTMTPTMSSGVPSDCVPRQRHSLQTVSPSTAARTSSERKSGTPSKTADQFVRTCSRPWNARSGWAGCSLP